MADDISDTLSKPQPIESARWFLVVVALIGVLISGLQFVLVRQQVSGFLSSQMDQSVSQALQQTQQRVNRAQYLMEALADMRAANPDMSLHMLRQFIGMTERNQNPIATAVEASVCGDMVSYDTLIFDPKPSNSAAEALIGLPKADDLIKRGVLNAVPEESVLREGESANSAWLVLVYPVGGGTGCKRAIIGYAPIQKLFTKLINFEEAGVITQLTVQEFTKDPGLPFVHLVHPTSGISLLSSYVAREKIFLYNRVWNVFLAGAPRAGLSLLALLPFIILGVGLLLTWALVMYLGLTRARSAEVARLASSLRLANDELSRRISDEGRMARALRESEQKYRAIFENAGIGICQIAPSGEWLKANRTTARILGYESPQELLLAQPDLHGLLFAEPEARRTWFGQLQIASQRDYETKLLTKSGQSIWANMNGHAVRDAKGAVQYFECTLYDVTERRTAERALRKAIQQADFANRSKSEFLANMSHELRTPLNAIIGFSEIIKDQLFGPVGQPQYIEYAQDIYDSGELLLSLINDILDMSKIEAGKRDLAESDMDIADIVRSVVRLVSVRAKAGRVKLNVHVLPDLPHVRVEEKAIKQVLTNLLTNAIKFTPEGGSVTLTAQMTDKGQMAISVEDTGIGMTPEDIPVALTPFGQIESVMSRKNQGTGLGLPLTKALVELHGGELKLESEVGRGTIVTVILPAFRVLSRTA